MSTHPHLSGVIVAALTPLRRDFSLALDDLPPFLDFLARRGNHGALLLGTTGEGPSFAPGERLELLQVALQVRQAHPDFKLLAGTGTPSLQETVELTRAAFDLGYDGVVTLPPYYFRKTSDEGLFAWFSQVLQRAVPGGGALLGYHIPSMTSVPLSLDLLARLKDAFPGRFAGIKDSSSDPEHARRLGERFGKDLLVFTGNDSLFSLALENSACGCISAMANLGWPDLRQLWDAHQRGQADPQAHARLEAARSIMERYAPFPPLYKALLPRLHGLPKWSVRPPLTSLPDTLAEQALSEAQAELGALD
ncbi:MAG: dihydrodipicolinate synthase family protein [Anaerolineales bacterium]|nr:dihydrodipicolinate synthase family protein [Anaerolineales bacterium]